MEELNRGEMKTLRCCGVTVLQHDALANNDPQEGRNYWDTFFQEESEYEEVDRLVSEYEKNKKDAVANARIAHDFTNGSFSYGLWSEAAKKLFLDKFIVQRSPEWYSSRKIGASDVGTILGLNRHKTAEELMEEKIRFFSSPSTFVSEYNEAMEHGARWENLAGYCFTKRFGCCSCFLGIHIDEDNPCFTVSPDLLCSLDRGSLVEIKFPLYRKILPCTSDDLERYLSFNPSVSRTDDSLTDGDLASQTSDETLSLLRECLERGNPWIYHTLTNLTPEDLDMFEKIPYYYAQMQFQNAVCRLTTPISFVQMGIEKNKYYTSPRRPMMVVSRVPHDDTWFAQYKEPLLQFWQRIADAIK